MRQHGVRDRVLVLMALVGVPCWFPCISWAAPQAQALLQGRYDARSDVRGANELAERSCWRVTRPWLPRSWRS
jgi:hypothetical protein